MTIVKFGNIWGCYCKDEFMWYRHELPPDLQVKIMLLNLAPEYTVIEKVGMKITDGMYEIYEYDCSKLK